jgi:hypothetical protein
MLILAATTGLASHIFSDVPTGSSFHNAISWMSAQGITGGCGSGKYCPKNAVTREQMALFMQRLAPRVTVLEVFTGTANDATIGDFEQLDAIGNFTKVRAGTNIRITWNSLVNTTGTEGTNFCDYQIRVDDTAPPGRQFGHVTNYGGEAPASATAIFPDVSAGVHEVSIWVRGSATSCGMNRGNFENTAIVEELSFANL